jgi:tetratricopeptide (TPR) repeat protein
VTRPVLLALALLAPAACSSPGPAKPVEVLTRSEDPEARRQAALALGEKGAMTDAPVLVSALRDPDPVVRAIAQASLWQVWTRSGDAETDRALTEGVELLENRQLRRAVEVFTRVIQRRPDFAEGWNKRATAYYLLGEYRESLADCDEVIKRNPYHFGALSGSGMNYLELDEPARALDSFERALAVNPNLEQVEQAIEVLRLLLRQQRRDAV